MSAFSPAKEWTPPIQNVRYPEEKQLDLSNYEDLLAVVFKKKYGVNPWDSVENMQKFNMFKQDFNRLRTANRKPNLDPTMGAPFIGRMNHQIFMTPNNVIPPSQNYLSNMPANQTGRPNPKSSPWL